MDDSDDMAEPIQEPTQADDPKQEDLVPFTLALIGYIQNQAFGRPLICLADSGADSTWINSAVLPAGCNGEKVESLTGRTMAGTFTSNQAVRLRDVVLPEFHRNRVIERLKARVFYNPCRYDIILGRDVLRLLKLQTDFGANVMTWDDAVVSMKPKPKGRSSTQNFIDEPTIAEELLYDLLEEELDDCTCDEGFMATAEANREKEAAAAGYHSKTILSSKYEKVDTEEVANRCSHLQPEQRTELADLLAQFPELFNGQLGKFKGGQIHLTIDRSVPPFTTRYYPVPHSQMAVFKEELDRLVDSDVLEKSGRSEWIAGTFIRPKKDGRVRWLSDFRALNKALLRKVYPLPRISDVLKRRRGYKYVTKIDLSMCYYTYELDEESRERCTIATPFGLYRYKRLPMGIAPAPDIAQELIEKVLEGLDGIEVYIDDVAVFSNSWEDHIKMLQTVLSRLQEAGYTVNPLKCEWAVQETDFLGHWLTPDGIKPWKKKVDAILKMEEPRDVKQLRSFLGLVTYYRDMWPQRAHVLAPLTDLIGTKTFKWTPECTKAFRAMKALVARDTLLAYPDHNLPFDIETDASDYQLGAVIKQNGRPVAYYSRKLNSAQKNYTTIEKELLSIVETLKEFRTMLLGARINVYTDHCNLTHKLTQFSTQRVMRWRLLLEEYGCKYYYKKGSANIIADALSRVPTTKDTRFTVDPTPSTKLESLLYAIDAGKLTDEELFQYLMDDCEDSLLVEQPELAECLLVYPAFDEQGRHPFHFTTIRHYQQQDARISAALNNGTLVSRSINGTNIACLPEAQGGQIVLTDSMLPKIVRWYHEVTVHLEGVDRLETTIRRAFHHPRIRDEVRRQVSPCLTCQRNKRGAQQHGQLAPREAILSPWQEVHVDCIGPWKAKVNGVPVTFHAVTAIDPVTNLVEIQRITGPTITSQEVADIFENMWLSRYPRPLRCVHDNGPEFVGHEFQFLLLNAGIITVPISSHNPQSNAIIESVHRSIGVAIRTLFQSFQPTNAAEAVRLVNRALATAMHATRCASHSSLNGASPGGLTFHRDMFMDIPFLSDLITIHDLRQQRIDQRLLRANSSRLRHEFRVGEQVLKRQPVGARDKLRPSNTGPYTIEQVHTNGTVTIRLQNNIRERINIRRILPYRSAG